MHEESLIEAPYMLEQFLRIGDRCFYMPPDAAFPLPVEICGYAYGADDSTEYYVARILEDGRTGFVQERVRPYFKADIYALLEEARPMSHREYRPQRKITNWTHKRVHRVLERRTKNAAARTYLEPEAVNSPKLEVEPSIGC